MIHFDEIKIHQHPYQQLIDLLNEKTKINLNYYRRNFVERRIKARMIRVGCNTLKCYYHYVLTHNEEINNFLNNFTINYSYFFRNWEVFDLFQKLFLKSLDIDDKLILCDLNPNPLNIEKIRKNRSQNARITREQNHKIKNCSKCNENSFSYLKSTSLYQKLKNKKFGKSINIWSCPCASGEEPYSIAMILDNLNHQITNFPEYRIVASDIDEEALIKAKKGTYQGEAVKEISDYFEKTYFYTREDCFGNIYSIKDDIKNQVDFIREDVIKCHKSPLKYDIVFFRYLLIYFDREQREKIIKIIENHLNIGGLVFLGKTETLFNFESKLKLIDSREHVYLKV